MGYVQSQRYLRVYTSVFGELSHDVNLQHVLQLEVSVSTLNLSFVGPLISRAKDTAFVSVFALIPQLSIQI